MFPKGRTALLTNQLLLFLLLFINELLVETSELYGVWHDEIQISLGW